MKSFLLVTLIVLSSIVSASEVTTKIHDILAPDSGEKVYLILAESGDVFEINVDEKELIENVYTALENQLAVKLNTANISINKILGLREIISSVDMISMEESAETESLNSDTPTPLDNYNITSLDSYESAQALFRTQNSNTKWRSQCYNRAHVWSYELSKRSFGSSKIKVGKMWLFFTARYIKEFKYKWWFHVSPFIEVNGEQEEIILDREFLRNPAPLTAWKNDYMKNKARCPKVQYYSDYHNNQWAQYCFLIKSSMYYWQPYDIENLELGKPERLNWDKTELERAYRNAIKGWDGELR